MLQDKTIIVTGASSGIGMQTALTLSNLGAKCVLVARNIERLQKVADACKSETHLVSLDLLDLESYDACVSEIYQKFGPIYGFVHSAGIEQTVLLQQIQTKDFRNIFDVNVVAAIEMMKRIAKKKYRAESQSFVLVSSIMGIVGNKGLTAYSASKGAVISMVKSLALELASKNTRVNAVSPGHISDSKMSVEKELVLAEEAIAEIVKAHPLGLGKSEDVANLITFLLSEKSRWITGQNMIIDGGYSIQ
ncbi:MAG: SDR family oxidoreductase [Flavobacteriales bacterium]|nr:MAG: SDR family oxidoreductase [Flavobacteriales bacterium]